MRRIIKNNIKLSLFFENSVDINYKIYAVAFLSIT